MRLQAVVFNVSLATHLSKVHVFHFQEILTVLVMQMINAQLAQPDFILRMIILAIRLVPYARPTILQMETV